MKEFGLTASDLDRWIKQAKRQAPSRRRIIVDSKKTNFVVLHKENQRLKMPHSQ
ncbi:hypothetical protein ACFVQB_13540 [Paenibacillus sp. NPDC057886]|uniref:hypothetical protein n=1 Tax=Paenibacillus sp. NPDC057886 TaxID=3346270 RepID=UPI0036843223